MAKVMFDHVTKAFGDVIAVNDFTLEIADGEFLVLVGPSGSGKSTALRVLAGLEEITGGQISIGDRVVNDVPSKDRDIAMVFQSYALYPHMSVFDNMAFGLKLRKFDKREIRRRVEAAAEILDLGELLKRKPRQLSGGQRQRVALGRAIVREPAAFLLDEPLSNLDAKLRVQTRAEISKLHQRLDATFVYVTHDQVEAMTMATRIAVMDQGLLQQVGASAELYSRPANMFVAGFIGSPAMNFFDVTVSETPEAIRLDAGAFQLDTPRDLVPALAARANGRVVLGIRPEHIHDRDFPPLGVRPAAVSATVDLMELMGSEIYLHLDREGTRFLARVDPRSRARAGREVGLIFDLAHLHAFDPESRRAIPLTPAAAAAAPPPGDPVPTQSGA